MTADTVRIESRLARTRGRESRTQSIATRFTRGEEKALVEKRKLRGRTSASGHAMCYCARLMGQSLPLALTKS